MEENNQQLEELLKKLDFLVQRQEEFSKQIKHVQDEVLKYQYGPGAQKSAPQESQKPAPTPSPASNTPAEPRPSAPPAQPTVPNTPQQPAPQGTVPPPPKDVRREQMPNQGKPASKRQAVKQKAVKKVKTGISKDFEKLIGENLISKIGIAILVLGVGVGAKYAISNDLISPLTRIILGYGVGAALLGWALWLKKKYTNLSAVVLSGALATMYLITYLAYDFYELLPQTMTFALMVVFTAFTVLAAVHYNKQVIAHIGLVGAYAVPFLLSNGQGQVGVLFTYVAVINTGILILSFMRYWKSLYYAAFLFTWAIFGAWYGLEYKADEHFGLTFTFLGIFFGLFYATFLSYKLIKKEKFRVDDMILLVFNGFIFFGYGYNIIWQHPNGDELLGLFTLGNAVINFIPTLLIYKKKLADRSLFYFAAGMVLLFITIAIPIQMDGSWVTLIWTGEALLLFWIARGKKVPAYEVFSYALMLVAFVSLIHDWGTAAYVTASEDNIITPFANSQFMTSLLCLVGFIGISILDQRIKSPMDEKKYRDWISFVHVFVNIFIILVGYFTFLIEILRFWDQEFESTKFIPDDAEDGYSYFNHFWDITSFKEITIFIYTLVFTSIVSAFNLIKTKNGIVGLINFIICGLVMLLFLTQGLYEISELREDYLLKEASEIYAGGKWHIAIRYFALAAASIQIWLLFKISKAEFQKPKFRVAFNYFFLTALLWITTSEMIHWLNFSHEESSYKLGVSILWGVFALSMIGYGIWKKRKDLRITAFCLFGLTLLKLFLYDISHLDTIRKTIVFITLGVLLLIVSFLYNKYKHLINADEKTETES